MKNFNDENNPCTFERKINTIEDELDQNIRKVNERTHRLLNDLSLTITKTSQQTKYSVKRKKKLKIAYLVSMILFLVAITFIICFGVYHNSRTQINQFADKVSTTFRKTTPFQSKIDVNQSTIQIKHLVDEIKHSSELNDIVKEFSSDFNIHIIKIYCLNDVKIEKYDLNKIKDHEVSLKPGHYKAIFVVSKDETAKQGDINVEIKKRV